MRLDVWQSQGLSLPCWMPRLGRVWVLVVSNLACGRACVQNVCYRKLGTCLVVPVVVASIGVGFRLPKLVRVGELLKVGQQGTRPRKASGPQVQQARIGVCQLL